MKKQTVIILIIIILVGIMYYILNQVKDESSDVVPADNNIQSQKSVGSKLGKMGIKMGQEYLSAKTILIQNDWNANLNVDAKDDPDLPEIWCEGGGVDAVCSVSFSKKDNEDLIFYIQRGGQRTSVLTDPNLWEVVGEI